MTFYTKPWLKTFSGLSLNLSAGFLGAVVILPNLFPVKTLSDFLVLTFNLFFGIIFMLLTVRFEEILEL